MTEKIKKLKNIVLKINFVVFIIIALMIFRGVKDVSFQPFVTSIVRIFSYASLAIVILIKSLEYIYRDE